MDWLVELLKYIMPAVVLLIGVWIVLNENGKRRDAKERYEIRTQAVSQLIPLRLQAYERAILFLERISPENLVLRVDPSGKGVRQFQLEMVRDIREEYEHNMSQQLYIGQEGWVAVVKAKEQILALINQSAANMGDKVPAQELGRRVIQNYMQAQPLPTHEAIKTLKGEVMGLFRI